ncbi:hypothetical protein MAP00_000530 [Monascus purpureus]|nr:hypothetical protein MAP00_000530 [Monascus purpureus]
MGWSVMSEYPNQKLLDTFTAAFNALRTKDARRFVYQQLLEQLRPDEWREVQACADIHLKCDILGSLPLEIVAQIVQSLSISEVIVLRRVSKRWNTLLSSPVVYSTVLHIPSGDDLPVLEQRRRFIRHARRRVMLERGQPVSKSLYPSPQVPNPPARVAFDYFGGRCAWVDSGPDSRGTGIAVRCLRSGEMCRFHTENRDPVSSVRISDTIVATVTMRGYCHVWNHHTEEYGYFRLPSIRYDFFVVNGHKVAFCFTNSVTIWDFQSQSTTRTFPADPGMVFMALSAASNNLVTVHLRNRNDGTYPLRVPSAQAHLEVVRYSLDETDRANSLSQPEVSKDYLNLPLDDTWVVDRFERHLKTMSWCSNRTEALGLRSLEPESGRIVPPSHLIFISHDLSRDQIALHVDDWRSRRMTCVAHNIFYFVEGNDDETPCIWISNPSAVDSLRPAESMQIEGPSVHCPLSAPTHLLYGDSDFVLVLNTIGLEVWCFDGTIHPPNAIPLCGKSQ